MKSPTVSVIVPSFNRAHYLPGALASLTSQQTHGEFTYEVVVVDNASTDNTREVVEAFSETSSVTVRYLHEEKPGDAPPRNCGIRESSGDWLAFFDDDQFATESWLAELLRVATVRSAKIVGGPVHLDLDDDTARMLAASCRMTLREMKPYDVVQPYEPNVIPGTGNMLVHRSVFDDVGMFDETMAEAGSDWRLVNLAREQGISPWYAPEAVIRHRVEPERMTREYFRWDSLNGGVTVAREHHRSRGTAGVLFGAFARLGRAAILSPRILFDAIRKAPIGVAESHMMWWRTVAYIREVISLVAPKLFPQDAFHRLVEFRTGRLVEADSVQGHLS